MTARRSPKKWLVSEPDQALTAELASALGVSPIVAGLLVARGHHDLDSAHAFLTPNLDQLHDPFLMRGMTDAVMRLLHAMAISWSSASIAASARTSRCFGPGLMDSTSSLPIITCLTKTKDRHRHWL